LCYQLELPGARITTGGARGGSPASNTDARQPAERSAKPPALQAAAPGNSPHQLSLLGRSDCRASLNSYQTRTDSLLSAGLSPCKGDANYKAIF